MITYLLLAIPGHAAEGIDPYSGGYWNDDRVEKPWSQDGSNLYGENGYCFFHVMRQDMVSETIRPATENMLSSLPSYVGGVIPLQGAYSNNLRGYLNITGPTEKKQVKIRSGLLKINADAPGDEQDILRVDLKSLPQHDGTRMGIFFGNGASDSTSPSSIGLRTQDGSWSRSIRKIPATTHGFWIFFHLDEKCSGKSLIISLTNDKNRTVGIGGLTFDTYIQKNPGRLLYVKETWRSPDNSSIIWVTNISQQADEPELPPWSHRIAMIISKKYRDADRRLAGIDDELSQLPSSNQRAPTGTAGYLSQWHNSAKDEVSFLFEWEEPRDIDAVAVLPLRLPNGEEDNPSDNDYWPGVIEIRDPDQPDDGPLAKRQSTQTLIKKSLPELIEFPTRKLKRIEIVFTELQKHATHQRFTAGCAELMIFSGRDNIAPRAKLTATRGRTSYQTLSTDYLTDSQTALGLPEQSSPAFGGLGIYAKKKNQPDSLPYLFDLRYPEDTLIDAVRIDPANLFRGGHSFPLRFSIQLLDAERNVITEASQWSEEIFQDPGSNPFIAYFPETMARIVRLKVFEGAQLTQKTTPAVQFSDISPMFRGEILPRTALPREPSEQNSYTNRKQFIDANGKPYSWSIESAYDGMTQSGEILPVRTWVEGLAKRQALLEERMPLVASMKTIRTRVEHGLLWIGVVSGLALVCFAIHYGISSRKKARRKIRRDRERIASDLHDEVGSSLGTISIYAEGLLKRCEDPADRERLSSIIRLAKESSYGLREVLHNAAPSVGRCQSIVEYLSDVAELMLADIPYELKIDSTLGELTLSPALRKNLLFYYKEALFNARTHSRCQKVDIAVHLRSAIEIGISDDGVGMSGEQLAAPYTLRTLKQRAEDLRAELKIRSNPGAGTSLLIVIPIS
ncbi:MAG: histidine kinase [Luteolibacter sp.]